MPPTIAYPRVNPKLSLRFYLTTERRYTENTAEMQFDIYKSVSGFSRSDFVDAPVLLV